ncbi:hypothetical protein CRUP_022988 [Coryphaenoides rupestris]|nr:hypothetical protein CRUP_022988 [Coryphaenoides rupestris]
MKEGQKEGKKDRRKEGRTDGRKIGQRKDADRAQKHGMDEFISANPCSFDHAALFEMVQRLTLDHRLNDTFCCLVGVRLTPHTSQLHHVANRA